MNQELKTSYCGCYEEDRERERKRFEVLALQGMCDIGKNGYFAFCLPELMIYGWDLDKLLVRAEQRGHPNPYIRQGISAKEILEGGSDKEDAPIRREIWHIWENPNEHNSLHFEPIGSIRID